MDRNIAVGVDIGGSHISCAAVDLVSRKVLKETLIQMEVNNQAKANIIIDTWAEALRNTLSKVQIGEVKGIGFAMPGPFDYVNGICYIKGVAKYENLYGFNISDAISSSLETDEELLIRFMNDASSFAVGEAWAGGAKGAERSLSITLGTGFGSAFIENRIPVVDGSDVPKLGCIYHIPYKEGIADDYFSTRWFIGKYKGMTGNKINGVKELAGMASKDRVAAAIFQEFGTNLGIFLAPWLVKFKADILVVGGNISNAYNLFGSFFKESLRKEGYTCKTALSELKEDAALLGSAYLFDDNFWKSVQHALPLM